MGLELAVIERKFQIDVYKIDGKDLLPLATVDRYVTKYLDDVCLGRFDKGVFAINEEIAASVKYLGYKNPIDVQVNYFKTINSSEPYKQIKLSDLY